MTRIFTDGAEGGDVTRWDTASYWAASTATKRTGTYCYYGGPYGTTAVKVFGSAMTEFYVRFAYYSCPSSCVFFQCSNSAGVGIQMSTLVYGSQGTVNANDGTTFRATSSVFFTAEIQWHVFEIHVKHAANPDGIIEVKHDGALVIDYHGTVNTRANTDRISFHTPAYTDSYWDDFAVNDTAGGVDNSWCGDGGVLAALVPMTGAAQYSDLIASTGNAWDCVNEIPSNTTDYVYESTVDKKSTYIMTDMAALATGATIQRVWVELVALETAADGLSIATLLRSNTTDAQGSDQVLSTGYSRKLSAEYLVDPADSAAWTEAKVNALQAGAVVR